MSTAFATLAQVVGEGIGHANLPIIAVPHPLGHPDESVIHQRGVDIAEACVRVLVTESDALARELEAKPFPLPSGVMRR